MGRELVNLLNLAEKEGTRRGDQFIASEMFLLALTEDEGRKAGEAGRIVREAGRESAGRSRSRSTGCAAARPSARPMPRASARR